MQFIDSGEREQEDATKWLKVEGRESAVSGDISQLPFDKSTCVDLHETPIQIERI
jgi:hypothetical protein